MERAVDLATLAVGAAAVVLAVVLFGALPESPRPARQFLADFDEVALDADAQEALVGEGTPAEFAFQVPQGNVSRIRVTLAFRDDVAASDPDFVRVHLVDPAGVVRQPELVTANALPVQDGGVPPGYAAQERRVDLEVVVHDAPDRQVVAAAGAGEGLAQAAARVAPLFAAGGAGTWTVRVAVAAGDCPAPELDPARSGACRAAAPSGADDGNPVQVAAFRSLHWALRLAPVEA